MTTRDLQESAARRDCLDDNEIVEYARGLASPAERAAVERHIDRCADCRVALSDLARSFGADTTAASPGDPTLPSSDATAPGLLPLERLGRYLVLHRLGAGGMGVVHAGYDPELDRKVALKLLASPGALDSEGQARLIQEAQALAMVSHPQVVAVHDVGVHQGCVWLAMEYIDGATLSAWLRARPRGWREVLAVFMAAGEGLAAVHAVGLVHRDFKPKSRPALPKAPRRQTPRNSNKTGAFERPGLVRGCPHLPWFAQNPPKKLTLDPIFDGREAQVAVDGLDLGDGPARSCFFFGHGRAILALRTEISNNVNEVQPRKTQ